ncbi:hypothetical protein BLS_002293 [Venturia inaequalis]|uniref:AAA+ ATPase domain-containing protein n=1 Tax=Venturia inaequalis TaxID=5025 RepID=A0A8H3VCX8_VENIN|nr:hypothetical protein BLS_002293 [Venturia inaequalis]KAE9985312.1 hypothetical protein EG327_004726 [Venturia inaequalis]
MNGSTGLTITNPLVLYRALIATSRIRPDPSQLRLALHLQKLYESLKDYEPQIEYSQRLSRLNQTLGPSSHQNATDTSPLEETTIGSRGIWTSLLAQKEKRDSLALTRVLTSHEEAMLLDSPKGMMLHGSVGTGKSMLIDLFADSLPTRKKKRWHFNTFMLETFSRLEELRRSRLTLTRSRGMGMGVEEHSMLWLARDLIQKSPILFLDEFQLPDRTASKILTNLMTSFFQLGGVLVATSNRMPDELAKAAGVEFVPPAAQASRRWGFGGANGSGRRLSSLPGQAGEFAMFLELLKKRCDVWEMEGGVDYRRSEASSITKSEEEKKLGERFPEGTIFSGCGLEETTEATEGLEDASPGLPHHYYVHSPDDPASINDFKTAQLDLLNDASIKSIDSIPWKPSTLKVYGRTVFVPRTHNGTSSWTFAELCTASLGPADYISLSSTYHTFIISDIPILTSLLKNEARRFITLLDALYEARCKLILSAAANPDDLFFPERRKPGDARGESGQEEQDAITSESYSDLYQDATAPFRPNISSYQNQMADDALEDDPPNRAMRQAGVSESDYTDMQKDPDYSPNFSVGSTFIGEDEVFAFKRATSRLWEMCGEKWHAQPSDTFWRPLPKESRRWEGSLGEVVDRLEASESSGESRTVSGEGMTSSREVNEKQDEIMFRHNASPFRTSTEPPPKFNWTHVWGTVKWGKKAGAWGQGVEGLKDRKKEKE